MDSEQTRHRRAIHQLRWVAIKGERYSALWVLVPMCAVLLTFTGGMRFCGWFERDMGVPTDGFAFTLAFVFSLIVSVVFVVGYPLAVKKRIPLRFFRVLILGLFCASTLGLSVVTLFDAVAGQSGSYILAVGLLFIAVFVGALLRKGSRSR